ncbi:MULTISPECIES: molybdenum cofactor cytidylyltransferase [Edwardsiella]|uniref:Molybdenum cofactor cytidylyltransferase n=1 Tax=Edwardsiella tarda TaxID=636 RepID=A0A2A7TZK8_EDWTA|nr:molybdenum cofactor cytidylyltransferase [Edwardsiella tarda]ATI64516.1 molybdenum cofactor cytidylyltransferase [Edwardsiella tarda]PEH71487.1 molybdenum cofactor cytidylyltransferase [Edwardsiella tarda]UCQ18166.1 molybdenum cofactor cytidylyltransferase [Edwardsiella tarda]
MMPAEEYINPEAVSAIIPAAGLSSRMGQWKMMLPYRDGTILDASINNALGFCQQIILVVGFRAEVLLQRYGDHPRIKLVVNKDYASGLFSSIRCGAASVQSDYCFICHGDMPCLTSALFAQLWRQRGPYALLPRYRGVPGHPVLLPRTWLPQVGQAYPQRSMREYLLAKDYRYLDINSEEIIFDVDTPQAYQLLLQK